MALLPNLTVNVDGWGPIGDIENIFPDIPYAPFSKGDKLGKAADWTAVRPVRTTAATVTTAFNAFEEEDEEDYSIVDTRPQKKGYTRRNVFKVQQKPKQGPKVRGQNWQQQQRTGRNVVTRTRKGQQYYPQQGKKYNSYTSSRTGRKFMPSIEVLPQWGDSIQTIEFSTLTALEKITPPEGENLVSCGRLEKFNENYDKLTVRNERSLEKADRRSYCVTTGDDPVLNRLTKEGVGNVYATDAILAVLMCSTKSVYSWDLIVRKKGDDIFVDKRDESSFDYLTVNENASEPPVDESSDFPCNNVDELHKEATYLNFSFSQQLLLKDEDKAYKFPEPNPFHQSSDGTVASVAYQYRRWDLGDGITLVARTEVDGYKSDRGKPALLVIKAVNEYDPKITGGWRSKLESAPAGCFATEVKNNSNKLARWAVQSHLSGAEEIKLGYVSRVNPRDHYNHVILGVKSHKPNDFAREIGIDFGKMWSILKSIILDLKKLDDGKYVMMKEGTKKQLVLYKSE